MELPPENPAEEKMKLYVLVRESVPLGIAMVSVAHAPLCGYLKFQNDPDMQEWLQTSFRKVVCVVSDKVFESCKKMDRHFVITESKYGGQETAIVFCPRKEWPRKFHYFRMYGQEPRVAGVSG